MPKQFHIEMPFAPYNRAMLDAISLRIAGLLVYMCVFGIVAMAAAPVQY